MIEDIKFTSQEIIGGHRKVGIMGETVQSTVEEKLLVKINGKWVEVRTEYLESISFKDLENNG